MLKGNTVPVGSISEELPSIDVGFSLLLSTTGEEVRSYLMGRVLTIIDASLPVGAQTEAVKSLIRYEINKTDTEVWRAINKFSQDNELISLHKKGVSKSNHKE